MVACDAGHAWARANIKPGMTELDVYCGVQRRVHQARRAGRSSSTATSRSRPGRSDAAARRPTASLKPGDMFILDFSVVIVGYRSDFTNTLVVGGEPNADQQRLYDLCMAAMAAGEAGTAAGAACQSGLRRGAMACSSRQDGGQYFPHHAGHGLG